MVRTYIRKSERRITSSEIVLQAVRKVIIDKRDKSEVIAELGIPRRTLNRYLNKIRKREVLEDQVPAMKPHRQV